MWGWVLLLIFSLIAGAFSISYNIGKLSEIYSKENINVNLIVFQNIVSVFVRWLGGSIHSVKIKAPILL